MVPEKLTGKEFETLILKSAKREESSGTMLLFRYGVQGVTFGGKTMLLTSLPDFGGVMAGGRQINIEAKCCAGASFPLASDHFRDRQYSHMVRCAKMGGASFLLIHFAARRLVSKIEPGMTIAVPVNDDMPFWRHYEAGAAKSMPRDEALTMGHLVPWTTPKGCRVPLPDLSSFLQPIPSTFQLL